MEKRMVIDIMIFYVLSIVLGVKDIVMYKSKFLYMF